MEAPRPMTLGEILDRTAHFYRSRFWVFFGISVLPTGVILVIAAGVFLFLTWWGNNGAGGASKEVTGAIAIAFLAGLGLIALPLMLGMTALAEAAMTQAVNRAWYGEKTTIRAAYAAVWPRGWRYIWLYGMKVLAVWGPPAVAWLGFVVLSVLAAAAGSAAGSVAVGLLFLMVLAALAGFSVWMALWLSLIFPACVVEQITAWAAVKRSGLLSKGTRGRIFLLYLLGVVLGWVLASGILIVASVVMALIPGSSSPQRAQATAVVVMFVAYAGGFAVQALTKPVYGIALVLFYYDQRIRLEGFDIEWMMARAGLVAPAAGSGAPAMSMNSGAAAVPAEHAVTIEAAPAVAPGALTNPEQSNPGQRIQEQLNPDQSSQGQPIQEQLNQEQP